MTVGNKWVYRVSSDTLQPSDPSVIGAASVFTIQPSPAYFGCSVPFNNGENAKNATSPWEVDLTKVYPGAYWQPTLAQHLRWFLGVPPTGQAGAGAIFQLGWIAYDYSDYNSTTDAKNLVPTSPTSSVPYGQLVQGPDDDFDRAVKYSNYIWPNLDIMSCAKGTPQFSGRAWAATWRMLSTMVVPVGTFSNVLEAKYVEQGGGAGTNYETWYFANELGPIKIVVTDANWNPIITLELVSWTLGNGTSVSSSVTLRDALIAKAGRTYGLTFSDWASALTQVTNVVAPNASQSCMTNARMTVDQYLATVEEVGSSSCKVIQYPSTYNGMTTDAMLANMQLSAGASSEYVYDWDQWAYYYQEVEGQPSPAPDTMCMKTYTYPNVPSVIAYNRYLLLTPRQWLLFFEHEVFGCAS
jgi:hypothetical protein